MELQDEALDLGNSKLLPKTNSTSSIRSKYQHYLRKASLLFLSVSLLSFLLSFFTGLSFLHSYTYYFSTFLLPILTQSFERKYMFLLCNGILVFLAGKSGLRGASSLHSELQPEETEPHDIHKKIMNIEDNLMLQPAAPVHPQYEEEAEIFIGDEQHKTQAEAAAAAEWEEDSAESEGTASNTEELNKKIEDFIRKMKEELQLEAQQQQLIAA